MEKMVYQPPILTIVKISVERGFTGSDLQSQQLGHAMFEARRQAYNGTGETFTEFTNSDGNFARGSWD